jgi:putative FmdB family regulatory protein
MPHYDFFGQSCKKQFSKILTMAEYEEGKVICPHYGSNDVEQRSAAFYAITS